MLPVKFRYFPFSRSREEVENLSANQRPCRPSCFTDRPEKHKLSKRRIKSCFLSSFVEFHSLIDLNIFYINFSMKRNSLVSVRSRKCLSQSEARAAILFYQSARKKNTKLVEDFEILLTAITHAKVSQMRQKSILYYTKTNIYTKLQVNISKDDWEMSGNF